MNITSATPLVTPAALAPAPAATAAAAPIGARVPELPPISVAAPAVEGGKVHPTLDAEIERANQRLQGAGSLQFAVHDNRVVVRIVDPASAEIIREFPNTDLLDMVSKLQELSGIAVDEMV